MTDASTAFAAEMEAIKQAHDEATLSRVVLHSLISYLLPVDPRKDIVSYSISTKQRRALGYQLNHVLGSSNALGNIINGQIERQEMTSRRPVDVQASEQMHEDAAG